MRRLCLIISVIPAAAGFDVPVVDLNRREISITSSLCVTVRQETDTAEITHSAGTDKHTHTFSQSYFTSEGKSLLPVLTLEPLYVYKLTVTPHLPPPSLGSQVLEMRDP